MALIYWLKVFIRTIHHHCHWRNHHLSMFHWSRSWCNINISITTLHYAGLYWTANINICQTHVLASLSFFPLLTLEYTLSYSSIILADKKYDESVQKKTWKGKCVSFSLLRLFHSIGIVSKFYEVYEVKMYLP